MNALKIQWLRLAVHVGSLVPFAVMVWNLVNNQLTVDPIRGITLWTGKTALSLLILSLACTPLNSLLGWRWALKVRRALGLYAFGYVLLHLLTFLVLDYALNPALLEDALLQKPYALVGLAAFVILLPLAITSTKGWMKRLGQGWKRLHQGVYLAALLVIVHFVWLVKADIREPLTYGALVIVFLAARLPLVRQVFSRWRSREWRTTADRNPPAAV